MQYLAAIAMAIALATPQPTVLQPQGFQDFVAVRSRAGAPLCRVLTSQASWDRTLAPAAVMGSRRPFAPPAAFWKDHAVLFVARETYAGPLERILNVNALTQTRDRVVLDYSFTPNPKASSTIVWWMGAVVRTPLPPHVEFRENGRAVCTTP